MTRESIERLKVQAHQFNSHNNRAGKSEAKKSILSVDLESQESKRLLNSSSRLQSESHQAKFNSIMSEFDSLEAKEKIMNKMNETLHQKVDCYRCKQCGITSEFFNAECQKKGHEVTKEKGIKRFFSCSACKRKTRTINAMYPKNSCSCGGTCWTKSSMLDVKISAEPEKFRARGVEHNKFLGI